MRYIVRYLARGMRDTRWIVQEATTIASSKEEAKTEVEHMLRRMYNIGSWYVDWRITDVEEVR